MPLECYQFCKAFRSCNVEEKDDLRLVFTQVDPADPRREFSFSICSKPSDQWEGRFPRGSCCAAVVIACSNVAYNRNVHFVDHPLHERMHELKAIHSNKSRQIMALRLPTL